MSASPHRAVRLGLALTAGAALAACGTFDKMSLGAVSSITPYRVEVVQGNFVSREQVQALKPGMTRQQVRDVLGSPLLASVFHAQRWDYVFTLKRQGVEPQSRKLAVFFKGDLLDRFEGDEMPSEAEFIATLEYKRGQGKVPVLEASEESLKKFASNPAPAASRPAAAQPAATASYPPLEAPTR